jgi:hypothetical protein
VWQFYHASAGRGRRDWSSWWREVLMCGRRMCGRYGRSYLCGWDRRLRRTRRYAGSRRGSRANLHLVGRVGCNDFFCGRDRCSSHWFDWNGCVYRDFYPSRTYGRRRKFPSRLLCGWSNWFYRWTVRDSAGMYCAAPRTKDWLSLRWGMRLHCNWLGGYRFHRCGRQFGNGRRFRPSDRNFGLRRLMSRRNYGLR